MSRNGPRKKYSRLRRDPVTGELVTTVLDAVQLAVERVHAVIDGKMLEMSPADRERFVGRLEDLVRRMKPHAD